MDRAANTAPGPDLVALLDGWAAGHGTLARRLAHALRHVIDAQVLASGARLPPERALARQLAVGRTTVTQALDELRAEGRVRSVQGSGTYVAGPPQPTPFGTRIAEHLASGAGIDLAKGDAPDLSHLPEVGLEMWQLNAACGGAAVNVAGLPAMREAVAELYAKGGTTGLPRSTLADRIHVTAGSHHATALLVATLAHPGAAIAVEACTYAGIFDILDARGVRAVPIPMDRAGIIPESLDEVLGRERPAALYVQAGPQVPTGRVAPAARVRSVASVLDRHAATVIEDTTVAAVAFDGAALMLADACRRATVISTGSLSKLCWSGLRLGWLRAPAPVLSESVYRHLATDLGASVPSQLLAMQLLPHLDVIAAERRRRLATAVDDALELLSVAVPEAVVDRPDGGSILWVRLPVDDASLLVQLARHHGVRISPGSIHVAEKTPGPFVRIDVDRPAPLLREGMERLGRAWRTCSAT